MSSDSSLRTPQTGGRKRLSVAAGGLSSAARNSRVVTEAPAATPGRTPRVTKYDLHSGVAKTPSSFQQTAMTPVQPLVYDDQPSMEIRHSTPQTSRDASEPSSAGKRASSPKFFSPSKTQEANGFGAAGAERELAANEFASSRTYVAACLWWYTQAALQTVMTLVIFCDIHMLSKHSKRRTPLVNTLSILLLLFLSTALVKNAMDQIQPQSAGVPVSYGNQPNINEIKSSMDRSLEALKHKFEEMEHSLKKQDPAITQELRGEIDKLVASAVGEKDRLRSDYQQKFEEFERRLSQVASGSSQGRSDFDVEKAYGDFKKGVESKMESIESSLSSIVSAKDHLNRKIDHLEGELEPKLKQFVDASIKTISKNIDEIKDQMAKSEEKRKEQIQEPVRPDKTENSPKISDEDVKRWIQEAINAKFEKILQQKYLEEASRTGDFSFDDVTRLVDEKIRKYHDDQIGLPDFALQSAGASIVLGQTSEPFRRADHSWPLSAFFRNRSPATPPSVVLDPDATPGNCYAFAGSRGRIGIRLADPVVPEAFSLEHISSALAFNMTSCPKDFAVWGLQFESDTNRVLLGNYTYVIDGGVETFTAQNKDTTKKYPIVVLEVLSNYGNEDYTCVYRFRVHGSRP
eukprot:TRINITY_DN2283_c0_g1_i1.p1 TRINITY_DN2283_c0_g1~~TRINITY_DN2283_c0_g1_i1.p1  ORF type:complete len:631 (+),score=153.64 TRINITY_DN2283_c0_g1_i1:103-1995(+)